MTDDLYRQNIMDHGKEPRHYGLLPDADAVKNELNPSCGDEIKLTLKLDKAQKKIIGVGWEGRGCLISRASMSMLSEKLIDLPVKAALELDFDDLTNLLGFTQPSPGRAKCMMLGLRAVQEALNNSEK